MSNYCDVRYAQGRLLCDLPLTTPTGKVRVLRNDQPLATRQNELRRGDMVEWQISYFADEHKTMVELALLLDLARKHNLVETTVLRGLLTEISAQEEFFATKYSISIAEKLPESFCGFSVLRKAVPVLAKEVEGAVIWVELRHKQRAVGFQPMLYLRIPVEMTSPNLIGRTADARQIVAWEPPLPTLLATVKAFSVASEKHHRDMQVVLKRVLAP